MCEEVDAKNEDVSLWPRADTEIPFVAYSELSLNRFDEYGAIRPKPIDSIADPSKHRWQLCSPVVTHLPQGITGDSGLRQFSKQLGPDSSLDLDRIATRNIYSALAPTQLIAR